MTHPGHIRIAKRSRAKGWRNPAGGIYVGRGSRWGNPHEMPYDATPEERAYAIEQFRSHVVEHPELIAPLEAKVADAREQGLEPVLVCWCFPLACHAEVLAELLYRREAAAA